MSDGEQVDMLFSVTVFSLAKSRGIDLSLADSADLGERLKFFAKIFYLGALNAWEYELLDNPGMGDMPYKAIDFAQWIGDNPKKAANLIKGASSAISGKDIDDSSEAKGEEGKVKKKSTSTLMEPRSKGSLWARAASLFGRSTKRR